MGGHLLTGGVEEDGDDGESKKRYWPKAETIGKDGMDGGAGRFLFLRRTIIEIIPKNRNGRETNIEGSQRWDVTWVTSGQSWGHGVIAPLPTSLGTIEESLC